MEDNKLILIENGEEKEYRILFTIEDVNSKNYIVYTNDEVNSNGDTLTYAGIYEETENGIKLSSIKDDKEWEFIVDVVNSIQNEE